LNGTLEIGLNPAVGPSSSSQQVGAAITALTSLFRKGDRIAIVQCKFWDLARSVGPNIIRDLIGARAAVGKIVEALLVITSEVIPRSVDALVRRR
jgi:hypothetical protein